jgi:tetratricopeptide (TPR) repeat protein
MNPEPIDSNLFISIVRPALETRDADKLAHIVKTHWTKDQICDLLVNGTLDARKVACLTLGLVGCLNCAECVSAALHDEDPVVCRLAEHAMWSIWMRSGKPEAMAQFKRGIDLTESQRYAESVPWLTQAIERDDQFTEAYNQRAIAYYMLEDYERSAQDCRRAIELCPIHFGALSGLAHCLAEQGDLHGSARYYRDALAVNPHMPAIAGALARIEQRINIPA